MTHKAILTDDEIDSVCPSTQFPSDMREHARDIEQAVLAKLAEQAPVAWLQVDCIGERFLCFSEPTGGAVTPLYAAPQPHVTETNFGNMPDHRAVMQQALPDGNTHTDDFAVDGFATTMKAKLSTSREKGRRGWDSLDCTQQYLSILLREHVNKGDPVDVANFCMFLWARGESIACSNTTLLDPAL